jgi:hypothetical protein
MFDLNSFEITLYFSNIFACTNKPFLEHLHLVWSYGFSGCSKFEQSVHTPMF